MSYPGECVPAFGEWGWGRDVCLVNYSWLLWHTWPFNRQISPSWALSDPANVHSKSPHFLPCPAFSIQTALRPLSVSACLREEGWFPCSQSPPVTSTPKFLLCDLVKVKNTFSRKVDTCHLHTNVTGWVKMWKKWSHSLLERAWTRTFMRVADGIMRHYSLLENSLMISSNV